MIGRFQVKSRQDVLEDLQPAGFFVSSFGGLGGTLELCGDTHDGFGLSGSFLAGPDILTVLWVRTRFLGGAMVQGGEIGSMCR